MASRNFFISLIIAQLLLFSTISNAIPELPGRPENLHQLEIASRSAVVGWSNPYSGNSPVLAYHVEYRQTFGPNDTWPNQDQNAVIVSKHLAEQAAPGSIFRETIPGTENSFKMRALKPMTSYEIRVQAENKQGLGPFASIVKITTMEEAPSGPPVSVHVYPLSTHQLKVTFEPPRPEHQNGQILGYYLGYKALDLDEPFLFKEVTEEKSTTNPTAKEVKIVELRRATKYVVIVQAFNRVGAGPRSEEVIGETLVNDPPSAPMLTSVNVDYDSVELSWSLESQGPEALSDKALEAPEVTGYILYAKSPSGEWEDRRVDASQNSFTFSQLLCGTKYQFYVIAYNKVGKGDPSQAITIRTKGSPPVAPKSWSSFMSVNSTQVTIRLDAWLVNGCEIKYFVVKYRPRIDSEWQRVSSQVYPSQRVLEIGELRPATWYLLNMAAVTDTGTTEETYLFSTLTTSRELPTFPSKDRFILDKLVNHYLCGLVEGESEKDAKPDEKYETLVSEVSRQMVTAREELHRTPTSRLHLLGLNRLITEREDMIVNLATTKFDQLHKRFVMIRQLAQVNDVIEFEKRLVPRAQLVDDDEQQLARLLVFNEGTRVMDKSFEKVAQSLSGNCLHWSQFLEAKWRRYRVNPTSRSLFYLRETFDDLRKTALDISNRIPTLDDDLPPYIYRNATRVNLMSSKQVYKEIAKFFEQYLRYLHSGTGLSEPISKSINRCVSFDYPEETRRMALKVDNAFKIMDYVELKNENFTLGDSFHKDYLWHIQKARVDALEELESPLSISYDLLQKAPSKPLNVQADSYHARKIVTQLRETFEKVAIKLVGGCLFWSETLNNQWQKFRANQSSSSEVGNTFSVLKQLASQLNTQANQLHGHYNLSSLPVETQLMIVTACREFQRLESLFDDYLRRMQSKATIFNIFNSITPPNISHQCPNSQNAIKTEEYATKLSKAKSQFLAKHNDLIEKKLGDKIYDKISETTRNLDLSKLSNQIEDTNVDDFQSRYVLSEWLARMEALNELKDRCLGRVDFYRGQSVEYFKENKNLAQLKVELDQIKSKFDNTSQVRGCSQWAVVLGTDWLGHLVSGIGFDSDTLRANFQRVKTAALQAKEDVAKLWNPLSIQDGYILPETELELITTEKTYEKIAALLDTFLQRMNTPQKEISISTNKAMTEMCHPVQRDFQFVDTSEKLLQLQANFITTLDSCALGEYSTETTNQILVEIRNQLRAIHDQINVTLSQSNENQLHHQYTLRTIMTHIDSLSSMLRSKIASGLTCPNFQQTSGHGGNLLSSIYDYMHWFEKDAVDGLELESKCQPWSVVLDGRWQRHWQHSSEEQSLRYALGKLPREAWRRHGYLLNNRKREPCTWRNENLCINNNMIHAFDRFEFVFNGTTTQLAQTAQWSDEYVKRLDNSSYPDNNDNATPKVEETSAPQCPTFEPVTEKNLSSVNPDQLHKLYFVQLRLSRDEASKKLENLNITKEPLSVANDPKIGLSAVESAMASIDINFDKVARDIAHGCQHWTQVLESQWKNYQNKPDNSTSRVLLGEAFYKLEQSAQNAQERAGQLWSDVATKPYPRNLLLEFAAREVFYQNLSSLFEGFLKRVS